MASNIYNALYILKKSAKVTPQKIFFVIYDIHIPHFIRISTGGSNPLFWKILKNYTSARNSIFWWTLSLFNILQKFQRICKYNVILDNYVSVDTLTYKEYRILNILLSGAWRSCRTLHCCTTRSIAFCIYYYQVFSRVVSHCSAALQGVLPASCWGGGQTRRRKKTIL